MELKKIGFIGLGAMGLPMAKRLCNAGFTVQSAVHKNRDKAKEIEACGGIIKDSFAEVAKDIDVLITILPQDKQLEEVLLDQKLLDSISKDTILIEMTSCTPMTMKKIAKEYADRGIKVFDAPVSGGTAGAESGTLTIFGGGDSELLGQITPVLNVMASKVYMVGEVGAGKALKSVNQMLNAINMVGVAEAFSLAKHMGLNLDVMYDVVKASSGTSFAFDKKFKKVVENNFDAGFKLELMMKDLKIALSEGEKLPLPLANTAYQIYKMVDKEYEGSDYSVVSTVFE